MPTKRTVSAGGIVFSLRDDAIHVVVCGRIDTGMWALPKGTPAKGEDIEDVAIREVREETGLAVEIVSKLGTVDYWFVGMPERVRYHKVVHFFLMRPVGGDISQHDWEFDVVRWVPIGEAYQLLTYDNEKEMLDKAEEAIRQLVAAGWKSEPTEADKPGQLEAGLEEGP